MTELLLKDQQERVLVAAGKMPPELVLKNATFVNVFTNELENGDIAIHKGFIVGIGNYSTPINSCKESEKEDSGVKEDGYPSTIWIDCTGKII